MEPEGGTEISVREIIQKLEEMLGSCVLVVGGITLRALDAINV